MNGLRCLKEPIPPISSIRAKAEREIICFVFSFQNVLTWQFDASGLNVVQSFDALLFSVNFIEKKKIKYHAN